MKSSKLTLVLFVFISVIVFQTCDAHNNKPCNKTYNCSKDENPVWATDGITCKVFRNKCWMESDNCYRKNNYQNEFKTTTRVKCKDLCPTYCTTIYAPICAIYRESLREFLNLCYMDRNNCLSGETYVPQSATRCRCYY